jgi:uncharacterized membrane protein
MTNRTVPFDQLPSFRATLALAGAALTLLILYALARALLGLAPSPAWAQASLRDAAILIHIATVVPALPLGLYVLLARKGTARHRLLGRIWAVLMATTVVATFFIRDINDGALSWIHILSALTIIGLVRAIAAARRGDIATHRSHMIGLFAGALLAAGLFTFVPGRLMWLWAFG